MSSRKRLGQLAAVLSAAALLAGCSPTTTPSPDSGQTSPLTSKAESTTISSSSSADETTAPDDATTTSANTPEDTTKATGAAPSKGKTTSGKVTGTTSRNPGTAPIPSRSTAAGTPVKGEVLQLESYKQAGTAFYDEAFVAALRDIRKKNGAYVTLLLPKGEVALQDTITLDGVSNLLIKGSGSQFMVHASCSLFSMNNSQNITLSDFTVDYAKLNFVVGVIQENDGREFTVRINEGYPLSGDMIVGSFVEFDPVTGAPRRDGNTLFPFGDVESVSLVSQAERLVKIRFKESEGAVPSPAGTQVLISQTPFDVSGIHAQFCNNLTFRNLTFYMAPGMGMFCTDTDNVTIENYHMLLNRDTDRLFSACRDGFHLINCAGKVTIRGCELENLGDDGLNIHSTWMRVKRAVNDNTVVMGVVEAADPAFNRRHNVGDVIQFRDTNMQPFETAVITAIENSGSNMIVTFDKKVTKKMQAAYLYNQSRSPRLLFQNNTITNIRGHGVLVQTDGQAVVRNNRFINNYYAGVKINTTTLESTPADNLVLENNYIGGSSYFPNLGDILVVSWAGTQRPGVFKNIIIRNNTIEKTADVGASILVSAVDGLTLEGNTLSNVAQPPRPVDTPSTECGIWIGQSRNITLRNNSFRTNGGGQDFVHLLEGVEEDTVHKE